MYAIFVEDVVKYLIEVIYYDLVYGTGHWSTRHRHRKQIFLKYYSLYFCPIYDHPLNLLLINYSNCCSYLMLLKIFEENEIAYWLVTTVCGDCMTAHGRLELLSGIILRVKMPRTSPKTSLNTC